MKVIFFGSTFDSVLILEKLRDHACAVVTQPPRPVGRKQQLTPTPVEMWAKEHAVTTVSFPSNPEKPWLYADEQQVIDTLESLKADLFVSACYGQKIPWETIASARFGGLNVHPSLLPRWRGADPVPWAILSGDRQTGVTIVTLSKEFDEGVVIAQKKVPITDADTSDALRTKLFTLGADLLAEVLPKYLAKQPIHPFTHSPITQLPYARRLTREDGFEPWEAIRKAFADSEEAKRIERKFRAFTPWPGLWTKIRIMNHELGIMEEKRLKMLGLSLIAYRLSLDLVQLEGKRPVSWKQFQEGYLPS
ncbi:methionyl-tRNA formyltransferase [Candidatus Gottesmanbacteria bacterium]|nr:methionyl-tRNA formyltransferase [Candidatus Gottesmanbacteria bacterium]